MMFLILFTTVVAYLFAGSVLWGILYSECREVDHPVGLFVGLVWPLTLVVLAMYFVADSTFGYLNPED